MTLRDLLAFDLIHTTKYSLSIYDLIIAIVILIITRIIIGIIKRIFKRLEKQNRLELGTSHAIFQIIKYVIWIVAIILVLDALGIRVTILLASSAALMVGLGLGLQQIFQDFVSGITLLIEGSLKVGDIVQMGNGEVGKVMQVGLRTSKVETRDNFILIVPNSKLINESLINWSHIINITRFEVNVGVAYGSDVELVKQLLLDCASRHNNIEKKPAPDVFFDGFGDSSLDFRLLFYTKTTFRVERIKSDIRFAIDKAFRENKVTIPFPQRDVHLFNEKA